MIEDQLPPLSDREIEVLKLVATGATNQEIARDLVISPNTVKVHLRNIFEKLGVASRTEATTEAIRRGLVWVEGATIVEPAAAEEPVPTRQALGPEPLAGQGPPISRWQRVYMSVAACIVMAAVLLPAWWQSQGVARRLSAFTDTGQPQLPAAALAPVPRWTARASLPVARDRLALLAFADKLYAIGGETPSGVTGDVTVFDPSSNGWLPAASKPLPVSNVQAAVLGHRIYVPGGTLGQAAAGAGANAGAPAAPTDAAAASSAALVRPSAAIATAVPVAFPASSGSTSPLPGAPGSAFTSPAATPLTAAGSTVTETLAANARAGDGSVTDIVEVYDPATDRWSRVAPLPAPRAAYALATFDSRLYLFGGWDGQRYRAETFIYDPASDRWTAGSPLPAPRAFMAAATLKDAIYVVGGYDSRRELASVTAYSPGNEGAPSGPWAEKAPLSQPRAGLGLLSLANRLYAIGGGWTTRVSFNEQYDMVSGAWSRIESPVIDQWRNLGLAALGEKIYAVGGWSGNYLALNEEYTAIYRVNLPMQSTLP